MPTVINAEIQGDWLWIFPLIFKSVGFTVYSQTGQTITDVVKYSGIENRT